MDKKDNNELKKTSIHYSRDVIIQQQKKLITFAVILIAVLAVAFVIMFIKVAKLTRAANGDDVIPISEVLGYNEPSAMALTDAEKQKAIGDIATALAEIRKENTYMTVQDGDDSYVSIVYNKKGEALAQASENGYITVYKSDSQVVRFGEYLDYGYDSEIVTLLECALQMARDGQAGLYKTPNLDTEDLEGTSLEGVNYEEYLIDMHGWAAVQRMYGLIDEEFGVAMVQQLQESLNSVEESPEGMDITQEVNFRYAMVVEDGRYLIAVACYMYFGDKDPTEVMWSEIALNWLVEGYTVVYDWELPDEWYTTDWSDEELDMGFAEQLLSDTYTVVIGMLEQFQADNPEMYGTEAEIELGLDDLEGTGDNGGNDADDAGQEETTDEGTEEGTGESSESVEVETEGVEGTDTSAEQTE